MSHDLDLSTGKPAMAYVGEKPWHGLGEQLPPGQPIEKWVEAARLNWHIQTLPVHYQLHDRVRIMPDRFVLARDDTGAALSIVSADYQVVQPKEILEFYRDLVAERHYTLETAGALAGGRKVWALAKTGLVQDVAGNAADRLGAYVLLATSCDKSLATTATFTSIRVVCQNTLSFAFEDVKKNERRHIKIDHTKKFSPGPIKEQLGLIDAAWAQFMDRINAMAKRPLKGPAVQQFVESLFLSDKETEEGKSPNSARFKEINQIMSLVQSGRGQEIATAKDTLWGAVNAVTNYVDHVRSTRAVERIDNAWFGTGAALKEKAWQRAMELIESDQQ
jgi:phage/plasmid-like protein (TIGR03299 family)